MASTAEQSRTDRSAVLPPHLPVNHTCDACSARAAYDVKLPSGGELLLCAHHARRHMDALTAQDAVLLQRED
jgi:hypothetical protein